MEVDLLPCDLLGVVATSEDEMVMGLKVMSSEWAEESKAWVLGA